MSAEHVAWVYRHSPAKGVAFSVHHAIADSVNDQHEHEFWMRLAKLSLKARVSRPTAQRAVRWLEESELLVCLDDDRQSGRPVRYRFLMPELAVVYETRPEGASHSARGRSESARGSRSQREGVDQADTPCLTQDDLQAEREQRDSSTSDESLPVERLCDQLADAVRQHRGGNGRPTISAAWKRDMRLLVERGPKGVSDPEKLDVERVAKTIVTVFAELAEPDANGFCWADQVQSPGALRRHWLKMRETHRRQQGQRTSKSARAIDRAAGRLTNGQSRDPLFPAKELTP